ncbi:AAA family ATPase, partial [Vibrio casei]
MIKESWHSAIPNFNKFEDVLSHVDKIQPLSFLDLQPRLLSSIIRFDQLKSFPRFLLINAPDNFIYRQVIELSYQDLIQSNHISRVPVITSDTIEPEDLFGQYQVKNGEIVSITDGLLDKADSGYLIISANLILANPRAWPKLKSAILGDACSPLSSDPRQITSAPKKYYDIKLVIVGDRMQLADFDMFDADVRSQMCLFGEVELELKVSDQSFKQYLGYVKGIMESDNLPRLQNMQAWEAFLIQGARETEDQERMPLCLIWHKGLLNEASIESTHNDISATHIQQALDHKNYRQSYLPLRALDDILEG